MVIKIVLQIIAMLLSLIFALGGIADKDQRSHFLPASIACLVVVIVAEIVWRKLL